MIFKPIYFFISLCIGLFLNYIFTPRPEIIYKYPTPQNVHATIYQDMTDNCYKYKAKEVQCTKDSVDNPPSSSH